MFTRQTEGEHPAGFQNQKEELILLEEKKNQPQRNVERLQNVSSSPKVQPSQTFKDISDLNFFDHPREAMED